jgi:hypothetical protein
MHGLRRAPILEVELESASGGRVVRLTAAWQGPAHKMTIIAKNRFFATYRIGNFCLRIILRTSFRASLRLLFLPVAFIPTCDSL